MNILSNPILFLILASGEKNGQGFWVIDKIYNDSYQNENKFLIEFHRKELIGEESSKLILFAINLNLENLKNDLKKEGFPLDIPPIGIPFNLPLNILEDIFDFWIELYRDRTAWETCIGLLKIKKRYSLSSLIMSKGIKRSLKEWACCIEKLHSYRPISLKKDNHIEPMWQ